MSPIEQAQLFVRLREIARDDQLGPDMAVQLVNDYETALNDLRVLWHAYTTDNRPPTDLQQRLSERFGR